MPSQPSTPERLAVLETWSSEHKSLHQREREDRHISLTTTTLIVVGVLQVLAVIAAAAISAGLTYVLMD
jgi:hypothetical protein